MITATATYNGSDIGFGEGESNTYAIEECIESVPVMYLEDMNNIELTIRNNNQKFRVDFRHFYQAQRQYF